MTEAEILESARREQKVQATRRKNRSAEARAIQREQMKNWRQENATYHAEYLRKYRESEKGRAVFRRAALRQRAKKRELVAQAKQCPCADCGGLFHKEVLDFDHRPGTKKLFGVATGFRFGVQTLLDEIAKCDVVCANCHRMRHVRRKGAPGPPPAGTGWWFQPDYEI